MINGHHCWKNYQGECLVLLGYYFACHIMRYVVGWCNGCIGYNNSLVLIKNSSVRTCFSNSLSIYVCMYVYCINIMIKSLFHIQCSVGKKEKINKNSSKKFIIKFYTLCTKTVFSSIYSVFYCPQSARRQFVKNEDTTTLGTCHTEALRFEALLINVW